jgi:hypothetical protein
MPIVKTKPDTTGCLHKFNGPTRIVMWEGISKRVGYCPACKNQVALVLDESGKPTGESYIVVAEL